MFGDEDVLAASPCDAAELARRPYGDGLPGPGDGAQPVDQGRRADRRGLPLPQGHGPKRGARGALSRCSRRCRSRRPTRVGAATRTSSRAASSSGSCSPWRSPPTPTCSCSTSRRPASTPPSRPRCSTWSSSCGRSSTPSILFVSHNLGIVARMCERVGVLYAGRLIEEGPARRALPHPRHPYTLALLRCMPRMGMRKDVDRLDPIPGSLPPIGVEIAGLRLRRALPDRARPLPGGAAADRAGRAAGTAAAASTTRRCRRSRARGRPPTTRRRRRPPTACLLEGRRPGEGVRVGREPGDGRRRGRHRGRPRRGARAGRRVRERQDLACEVHRRAARPQRRHDRVRLERT